MIACYVFEAFGLCTLINCLVCCAKGTVLMALLQPAPEVYDLFDDILLLCEGMPLVPYDT